MAFLKVQPPETESPGVVFPGEKPETKKKEMLASLAHLPVGPCLIFLEGRELSV